jgi:small subunit ribosomal protein S1
VVNKIKTLSYEPAPPTQDEGWWASLLAEDEANGHHSLPQTREKSRPAADSQMQDQDWDTILQIFENDQIVEAQVIGYNQGGLLVENDTLQGFVPISHLIENLCEDPSLPGGQTQLTNAPFELLKSYLSGYVGQWLSLKVIECDPERGRIVLSERAALAQPGRRNELLGELETGDKIHGMVTNITDFGVFVDLGGLEGLIHISELSWGRVRHPTDVLSLGEDVEVQVLQADRDRNRVALSLKRLYPNPWATAENRYTVGQVINVKITSVVSFGAFARVENGLDGLIHCSEMAPPGIKVIPWQVLKEGQYVQTRVVHIDPTKQRLGLSLNLEN